MRESLIPRVDANAEQLPRIPLMFSEECSISSGKLFGVDEKRRDANEGSCILELGIFASHIIWLLRTRKIRKAAAAEGKTFDDIAAEHEAQGTPFRFAERKTRRDRKRKLNEESLGRSEGCVSQNREGAVLGADSETEPKQEV